MKFKELTPLSVEQLRKDLADLRQQANGLQVKNRLAQVKNTQQLRAVRKDIARILTALKLKS
jgi:large subunit ribosomal protein L29